VRYVALIIGLKFGYDKDELKSKDLREIDESIKKALPIFLWGRTSGRFGNDVRLEVDQTNVNVVKYTRLGQFGPMLLIPYHDDLLIPTLKQSVVCNFWLLTMYSVTRK
jgi:hypothetical protein